MASIFEHANAIEAAIAAAAADGFELDNGSGEPIHRVELNKVVGGEITVDPSPVRIDVPQTYF